ncbi:hypothetical protein [Streptomyces antibioticus]|uniref:hypothetical protein n=1 Tax=Streptomyces antibioticus TaxID=1890 RepID=UPI0036FC5E0E
MDAVVALVCLAIVAAAVGIAATAVGDPRTWASRTAAAVALTIGAGLLLLAASRPIATALTLLP